MTGNKLRGLFLATLMVLSVFAGTVAFTGAVAAGGNAGHSTIAGQADANLNSSASGSSSRFWQGQSLYIHSGLADFNNGTYEVHEVTTNSNGDWVRTSNSFVSQIKLDGNGEAIVSTSNLDGTYIIENENDSPVVFGNGTTAGQAQTGNVSDARFSMTVQTLSGGFPSDTVAGTTDLNLNSNRVSYTVTISASGISTSKFATVFGTQDADTNMDGYQKEVSGNNANLAADFSSVNPGNYTVNVEVVDTEKSITDSITVEDAASTDANFANPAVVEERGDNATITIDLTATDTADVTVGSQDVNYVTNLSITDGDGDGEVAIEMNTFLAGVGGNDTTNESLAYRAVDEDDTVTVDSTSNETVQVLESGEYDLSVSVSGDEKDVAVLSIRDRSTNGLTTHTAPSGTGTDNAGYTNASDVLATQTPSDEVAKSDQVILRVDASGLYGFLKTGSDGAAQLANTTTPNNGLNLTVYQTNPKQNSQVKFLKVQNGSVYLDAENNQFLIVLDTDTVTQNGRSVTAGEEYRAEFTLEDSNDMVRTGQAVSVNTTFEVVERTASIDTTDFDGDERVVVAAADGQQITGETSVAPGTQLSIRAKSTGESPFLKSQTAVVQEDGTFNATFDFTNVSQNTTFDVTVSGSGISAAATGVVQPPARATVTFNNQTSTGDSVTVASATLSEGGFVTIHDATLLDGAVFDSVRGTSSYLEAGSHSNVQVSVSGVDETQTLYAMPHLDSNGNQNYDFVTSEGSADGPYTDAQGNIVLDGATVTIEEETPTETPEPETDTPEPETDTPEPETDTPTEEPTPTEGNGPGFGLAVSIIALAGAALLALRRD